MVVNHNQPDESLLARSDAVRSVLGQLGGFWRFASSLLSRLPGPLCDWGYRLVAHNRYRIFGRYDVCPLPTEDVRDRVSWTSSIFLGVPSGRLRSVSAGSGCLYSFVIPITSCLALCRIDFFEFRAAFTRPEAFLLVEVLIMPESRRRSAIHQPSIPSCTSSASSSLPRILQTGPREEPRRIRAPLQGIHRRP